MQVPTQEQFAEWLRLSVQRLGASVERPTNEDHRHVRQRLHEALDERRRLVRVRIQTLDATPVGRWISQNKEITRAEALVYRALDRKKGAASRATDELVVQRALDKAKDSFSHWDPGSLLPSIANTLTEWDESPLAHSWWWHCIKAFAEYFDEDAPQRMVEAFRTSTPRAAQAQRAMADYLQAVDSLNALNLPGVRYRRLERIQREVDYLLDALNVPAERFPLTRIDERSSERLFVFRMHHAHMVLVRAPRVEAIDELMGVHGFRHQYDRRSLERLCAVYTGRRKALRARFMPGRQSGPGSLLSAVASNGADSDA